MDGSATSARPTLATVTPSAARRPAARPSLPAKVDSRRDTRDGGTEPARLLVDDDGPGTFRTISTDAPAASSHGRLIRYAVRMEKDLPFGSGAVARTIHRVLSDPRSWTGTGSYRFAQVDHPRDADFTIWLATPETTDQLCAPLLTRGEVSCQNGNRVVLNARRWAFGADAYGGDVAGYRIYLINHEVGHRLGRGHVGCDHRGARASVMMQQTKGLGGCRANPWPAPNREQRSKR